MNVWAICAVRNEADIFGDTLRHMLNQNVDSILIADGMSTDGTRDIIERLGYDTGRIAMVDDPHPIFRQAHVMNGLAAVWSKPGDWVIPFDADEYISAQSGRPLADELRTLDPAYSVVYAPMYEYVDRDHRLPDAKPLPKVAYRWRPDRRLTMGQHSVNGAGPYARADVMVVREIQFRSREHFKRKVRERLASLEPGLPAGAAQHYTELAHLSDAELDARWDQLAARPTIWDPIR